MKFVVQKIWQSTKHQIVLKGSWFGEEKQKGFLILGYNKKSSVEFTAKKPENIAAGGNLMEILRKYAGKMVFDIGLSSQDKIMFPIEEKSMDSKVLVFDKILVQWSFEDLKEHVSYFRCTSQNVYTGRKSEVSISTDIEFESFKLWKKLGEDSKPTTKVSKETKKTSNRTDLKKKLRRKLKSLSKSILRFEKDLDDNTLPTVEQSLKELSIETSGDDYGESLNTLHQQRKKAESKIQKLSEQLEKFRAAHQRITVYLEEKVEHELLENIQEFFSKEKIKWQAPSSRVKERPAVRLPYRTFLHRGQTYRVGKAAADNDQLVKLSKPFDWWVHLQGSSSSHVVILSSSKSFEPSLEQIKVSAILANYFSKSKKSLGAKIVMTKIHKLNKPKGLKPGAQLVSGERVYDFSFSESDVKSVLESMQK